MKILLVVHYYIPHVGGMEAVVEKQAKSLVARGHEVMILTCRPQKGLATVEQRDGYTIRRLPALNFVEQRFGVTYPIISPLTIFWVFKYIAQYDIVHIHDVFYMSSHITALSCMLRRKVFFLTQHVAMVDYPSRLVMTIQRVMYSTFGKLLFSKAAKIVCYNHIVRDFLIKRGVSESKLFMQFNGIDTSYFSPGAAHLKHSLRKKYNLPLDRPIALFVGRLVPKKGYRLVYEAQAPEYFTLIVGDGIPPKAMTSNENIRLFGPASSNQLRDLYKACDVFVFPAHGEIFTLVMQEAMASGLPVITTDDIGYRPYSFSRKYIHLVERDSRQIKRSLKRLMSDEGLRKKMSNYSQLFASDNFDWQQNYENEYALYRKSFEKVTSSDA